jgi:hypothetical protein
LTDTLQHYVVARSSGRRWTILFAVSLACLLALLDSRKFYEWDEAVFASQFGGHLGLDAAPSSMAASREVGPAILSGLLGIFAPGLASLRLLWTAVTVAALAMAFKALGSVIGENAALSGFLICVSFWTVLLYAGSIYGSLLGAAASLLALALYLRLLQSKTGRPPSKWQPYLLGLALAVAFWFRHVETMIVLLVVVADALLVRRRSVFQLRHWTKSLVTFLLAFAVPWSVESSYRFGSPIERIRLARDQGYPTGLQNNIEPYIALLTGDSFYRAYGKLPALGPPVLTALLTLIVAGVVIALVAFPLGRAYRGVLALLVLISASSFSFFLFYGGVIEDRYVLYGVVFAAAAAGVVLQECWRLLRRWAGNVPTAVLASLLFLVWVMANIALFLPHERGRFLEGRESAVTSATIHVLAGGRPCYIVARYGAPQMQAGSGCLATTSRDANAAATLARDKLSAGFFTVVVWPTSSAPQLGDPTWRELLRRLPSGDTLSLFYAPAPELVERS